MRISCLNKPLPPWSGFSAALLGLPGAAFAARCGSRSLAGVGLLPVLAVAGGALWLVRRFSSRRQQ